MIDELYEATKKEVMTTKEEYRNADVPMPRGPNDLEEIISRLEKQNQELHSWPRILLVINLIPLSL